MKIKTDKIDLHDAILDSLAIDYPKKMVTIDISYYPDSVNSQVRVPVQIKFSGVEKVSEISDFLDLDENRCAGNISFWHPAEGYGTTYIYFISGVISVTAKALSVTAMA
jgi:hypothetical protein